MVDREEQHDLAPEAPQDAPQEDSQPDALESALSEAYDRAQQPPAPKEAPAENAEAPDDEAAPEGEGEPEKAEKAEKPAKADEADEADEKPAKEPKVDVPSEVPSELRKHWAALSEDARADILKVQREYSDRSAEQGRVVKQAKPLLDVIADLQNEIPALKGMAPDQIAAETAALARVREQMNKAPAQCLMALAQQYGVVPQLQAAFSQNPSQDQQTIAQMANEIRELNAQLSKVANPDAIAQQVSRTLDQRTAEELVAEVARTNEFFDEIAGDLGYMIPAVQARKPGASFKEVLDEAVDMAIHARPDLRARKAAAAESAPAKPNPEKTRMQMDATSVNIPSKSVGKTREPTLDEQLSAAFDRANAG